MPSLTISGLNKSYGTLRALSDLSFSVGAGEIFGFVGSNGAGKTTAMRIALGVLSADSGRVLLDDEPIDLDARRRVGYMPEERGLYPKMKVGEQLVYLARLHGLTAAAARSAMEHWTEILGVAERRGEEVQKLSLGNQQRVQLAAALVHDPDVLILDEPFSGLDPVAVDVMSGVLRQRADAGVPVVFSSHQLELVERLSDRVGIVRKGRLVAEGTIDELHRTPTQDWRIVAPSAPATWAADSGVTAGVAGAEVLHDGPEALVRLPAEATDAVQRLLQAALATSPVTEFTWVRPSLTDLFRHAVSESNDQGDEGKDRA